MAYLASEACMANQTVFSGFMGRVAALQIGIRRGWTAPRQPQRGGRATHLPEILDDTDLLIPRTLYDEMAYVMAPVAE